MLAMLAPIAFVMLSTACRSSLESLVSHRERPQLARLERHRVAVKELVTVQCGSCAMVIGLFLHGSSWWVSLKHMDYC